MNRKRLKGEGGKDDANEALHTLFSVLMTMIEVMAPFTPFLTELMYQNLKNIISANEKNVAESVHFMLHSPVQEEIIDEDVERQVSNMQTVIEVGRVLRDRKTLPLKYPLPDVVVVSKDQTILNDVKTLERFILNELNVRKIIVTTEKEKYGIQLKAEPDIKALGLRLRNASKPVIQAIRELTDAQLQTYQKNPNSFEVAGTKLEAGDIRVQYTFGGDMASELGDKYEAESEGDILVLLNVEPDSGMKDEGTSREIINRIQKLRKKAQLVPSDEVTVFYAVKPNGELERVIKQFSDFIANTLKAPIQSLPLPNGLTKVIEDKQNIKDEQIEFVVVKRSDHSSPNVSNPNVSNPKASNPKASNPNTSNTNVSNKKESSNTPKRSASSDPPYCKYVNIELCSNDGSSQRKATVLLENPIGDYVKNGEELAKNV